MPGKQKKSVSQVIAAFSKKFTRASANSPEDLDKVNPLSSSQKMQQTIEEYEEERILAIKKQFDYFKTPFTQEVEQDEENLVKAYELYCKLVEVNKELGDSSTRLRDFSLASPLCKKSDYQGGDLFLYLRLWFITVKPDALFVPEISLITTAAGPSYALTFIEKDEWKPSIKEKEILQIIE